MDFLESLLQAAEAKSIVLVGGSNIDTLELLLRHIQNTAGTLHVVDAKPQEECRSIISTHQNITLIEELSLHALPNIRDADVYLLDGDKNWYTVYHELLSIQSHTLDEGPALFPLVVVYGIGWPYGRRDAYAEPGLIPIAYKQVTTTLGLVPGEAKPTIENSLHAGGEHALYEGTPKNGVLTAVEDFVGQTITPLRLLYLPSNGGMGLLTTEQQVQSNIPLRNLMEHMYISKDAFLYVDGKMAKEEHKLYTQYEHEREKTLWEIGAHARELEKMQQKLEEAELRTNNYESGLIFAQKKIERNKMHQQKDLAYIKNISSEMQDLSRKKKELERENEKLSALLKRMQQTNSTQYKLLAEELERAHGRFVEIHKQFIHMHKTKSWRITAPLRQIGSTVNKFLYAFFAATKDVWADFGSPCPRFVRFMRHQIFRSLPPRKHTKGGETKEVQNNPKKERFKETPFSNPGPQPTPPIPASIIVSDTTAVVLNTDSADIRKTIESVIAQSLPPEDLIIVTTTHNVNIEKIANEYSPPLRVLKAKQHDAISALRRAAEEVETLHILNIRAGERLQPDILRLGSIALQLNPACNAAIFPKSWSTKPTLVKDIDTTLPNASCTLLRRRALIKQIAQLQ